MKIQSLVTIALAASLLGGCTGARQYIPIINASLSGGKGVAEAGKSLAVNSRNAAGCYTAAAFVTAIDSAQQVIDTWEESEGSVTVIPAVGVDIADCHSLVEGGVPPVLDEQAEAQVAAIANTVTPALVAVTKSIVLSAEDISCKDKVLAGAILDYFNGVVPVVIEELGSPDGVMTIPAAMLNLAKCE